LTNGYDSAITGDGSPSFHQHLSLAMPEIRLHGYDVIETLDPAHPRLRTLSLCPETFASFKAGYCDIDGPLLGCLVIPYHDITGALVGFAVRALDTGAYRFAPEEVSSGWVFNLNRAMMSRNWSRAEMKVFEDPLDVLRLYERRGEEGIALPGFSGPSLSSTQRERLRRVVLPRAHLHVLFRPTDTAAQVVGALARMCYVRWEPGEETL
jgi:hypothetical protein